MALQETKLYFQKKKMALGVTGIIDDIVRSADKNRRIKRITKNENLGKF